MGQEIEQREVGQEKIKQEVEQREVENNVSLSFIHTLHHKMDSKPSLLAYIFYYFVLLFCSIILFFVLILILCVEAYPLGSL